MGEFVVAELDENVSKLSIELRATGLVEAGKVELREIFTRDIGDQHEYKA